MQYGDLILHCEVRRLSSGHVLRRFWKLNNIVHDPLEEKDELSEEKLFCAIIFFFDLALTVDVTIHLNDLNL